MSETIQGVTAVAGSVAITITAIHQDEPVLGPGSGNTCPDGEGVGTATARVRAERQGGNFSGRVYHIDFTATDRNQDSCSGEVPVCVPHDQGTHNKCVDEGPLYDSTKCPRTQVPGRNRGNAATGQPGHLIVDGKVVLEKWRKTKQLRY